MRLAVRATESRAINGCYSYYLRVKQELEDDGGKWKNQPYDCLYWI